MQNLHHLLGVDFARQPGDFGAFAVEQHHRWVAADLEPLAEFLCSRAVTVHVHCDKRPRRGSKVLAIEERGLELVARRAPRGAPVHEHGLLGGARLGEGAVNVGIGRSSEPRKVIRRQANCRLRQHGESQLNSQGDGPGGSEGSHGGKLRQLVAHCATAPKKTGPTLSAGPVGEEENFVN